MTGETTSCEGFKKGLNRKSRYKITNIHRNRISSSRAGSRSETRSWRSSICNFGRTRRLIFLKFELKFLNLICLIYKADVVAFLKRTLQQRTDTIHELTDRLEGMKVTNFCAYISAFRFSTFLVFFLDSNLKVAHLSERSDYEGQLTDLRGEYAKTKEELEGEIMVLTKKLDSLEEFRQQKEQLSNKFDKLEGDSKDKMEEYEKKIYNLEKNHIREQDRLKKEMMERVENVAGEFRKAAHSQMAATTQRTIRYLIFFGQKPGCLTAEVPNTNKSTNTKVKKTSFQGECEYLSTVGAADREGNQPDERERQADVEGDGGEDEDLVVGHGDREAVSSERLSAACYRGADREVPIAGGENGTG